MRVLSDGFPAVCCPRCASENRESELVLDIGAAGDLFGIARCTTDSCGRTYPLIDGVIYAHGDVAGMLSAYGLPGTMTRDDLPEFLVAELAERAGPGSELDRARQTLSTYADAHFGETMATVVDAALGLVREVGGAIGSGAVLDVGCGVGGGSTVLAERLDTLVVGVDAAPGMVRTAERMRRDGRLEFPRRVIGMRYEPVEVDAGVSAGARDRTRFVLADAGGLPFRAGSFSGVFALNLLDCVPWPVGMLGELARVLEPGGVGLIATPFDWSAAATSLEAWIGGRAPRGIGGGSPAEVLKAVLSGDASGQGDPVGGADGIGVVTGLELVGERDDVRWRLRLHDRATMEYRVALFAVRRL